MTRPHYITPPIEESLPLFAVRRIDTPIAAARRSDPATSHAAAATKEGSEDEYSNRMKAKYGGEW